ncbi:phage integrase SAM-like domain-containing protein [Algibacter sp. PT7-4]|uniref:phage integrase SAM-like domain-containing protein n=1 Tax=Algibacter ulvanivorans TaxID=3400999 RepID=UPI003AAFF09F
MKATIKLISTKSKETTNGFPIIVELFVSKNDRPRKTIGYTHLSFWDDANITILNTHPHFKFLYPKLLEYKSKCFKVNYNNYNKADAIDVLFGKNIEQIKEVDLIEFFDIRISEKKSINQSYKAYDDVKASILKYIYPNDDVPINRITYEWLNDYLYFLLKTGCNTGGAMSYLRSFRAVFKEAQRRKSLNVNSGNPFLGIMKASESSNHEVVYSKNDVLELFKFIPKKSTTKKNRILLERNINVLLFQLYIGGHDLVDISLLTWSNIKNNRVRFKRYKNRNKPQGGPLVDNKIIDEAIEIINKYGTKKNDRVFSFIPSPIDMPKQYEYFRRNTNRSLSKISGTLGIPKLSTKSTRYMFRSFSSELEIYDLTVMKIQGHKPKGITFNYQGKVSNKIIDEALLKVIKFIKT